MICRTITVHQAIEIIGQINSYDHAINYQLSILHSDYKFELELNDCSRGKSMRMERSLLTCRTNGAVVIILRFVAWNIDGDRS